MSLVENVKQHCKNAGISIPKLEKKLCFGNGAIYNWDTSTPGIDKVKQVADYFGVTVDDLIREKAG
ncbi:XRE family transcriptional regulator [Dehalobacter sp.]|uniref:helix-turn-helix domain-containing protein n=1 Tax=Dehalobacter sp. TaxID=1962289 RepID=UPI00258DC795|nr:XRE family transcriptional regulator [Dehalobacter sp.]MDJ0305361.1 XRE family transcriptional regulator [Dehalobacter sp.]